MEDEESMKDFPDQDQRLAFCFSTWEEEMEKGEEGENRVTEKISKNEKKGQAAYNNSRVSKQQPTSSSVHVNGPLEIKKAVVDFQDLPLAPRDMEWDGDQAEMNAREWAGGPEKDEINWEQYRKAFLWYDPENPELFESYKFNIADIIDGELRAVPQGIFTAAAVLEGAMLEGPPTQTLNVPDDDIEEMRTHLTRYYEKMAEEFDDESIQAPWIEKVEKQDQEEEIIPPWIKKGKAEYEAKGPIVKVDNEKRIVYGIVLEPETVDSQGDVISSDEIERAAHQFMIDSRIIGESHEYLAEAYPVESFIAPTHLIIGGQRVKKGSWIMGAKIMDDELWEGVKAGEYTGFSVGGFANRIEN